MLRNRIYNMEEYNLYYKMEQQHLLGHLQPHDSHPRRRDDLLEAPWARWLSDERSSPWAPDGTALRPSPVSCRPSAPQPARS